jgi:hypothetical protein
MKKLIYILIFFGTAIPVIHFLLDTSSFKEWINGYVVLYLAISSVLTFTFKKKFSLKKDKKNQKKLIEDNDCIKILDHFHWTGKISAVIAFLIYCTIFMIWIYYRIHDPDLQLSSVRKSTLTFYYLAPTFFIFYVYYFVIKFMLANMGKKRYIKLCSNSISIEYPQYDILKDTEEKIDILSIKDIEKIAWSPLCNTIDLQEPILETVFKYPFVQLVWLPMNIVLLLTQVIYYYMHNIDIKYIFKNLIILSDEKDIMIQIKNEKEYREICQYFMKFDIDITKLGQTLSPYKYVLKGN